MTSDETGKRRFGRDQARDLRPGDEHYMAYVGPPRQYDFMGATQFRLLTALGLREQHRVLDFGCGSLRAGRLLIPYLLPGHYYGIEPNAWLIEDALSNQIGRDLLAIKKPVFDHNAEFRVDGFGIDFDFIVAQSIFSHTTSQLVVQALRNFAGSLSRNGLIACTFVESVESNEIDPAPRWVYPECVSFTTSEIDAFFAKAGLASRRIPWFHPRQVWYLAAHDARELPEEGALPLLSGAVLRDPELRNSIPGEK